ncbi:MAG: hypothetical protein U5R30_09565 [Deltaproteobacteria bacterium]|nr:hypothetical protein [Deltaproteobacteria bacterium]
MYSAPRQEKNSSNYAAARHRQLHGIDGVADFMTDAGENVADIVHGIDRFGNRHEARLFGDIAQQNTAG